MSKRTLFLIFALFIITSVLLVLALYKPVNPPPSPAAVTPKEDIAKTTLLFGELSVASQSGANLTYSLPINIATGKNKITAVQLELQYDPKLLTNVTITPGPFFTNPEVLLNLIDTKTGRISYAFGIGLRESGVIGEGVAATLTFGTNSATPEQTSILFLPKTLVTAEETNESVLKSTNVSLFTVGGKIPQ